MATTTRWWWVRHAPVANAEEVIIGSSDVPAVLPDNDTLARLAQKLPAAVVAILSPLRRTKETLDALGTAGFTPSDTTVDAELVEQNFGEWEGRSRKVVYDALGPQHSLWQSPGSTVPPGGESYAALQKRVSAAILRLNQAYAGGDVVAIGHAGPIRAALALALDLDPEVALRFSVDPLSITRIDHIADRKLWWRVESVNVAAAA